MANKSLFGSTRGVLVDTVNLAGGTAYSLSDKAALAQMAVTGCFNSTFYASPQVQLDSLLKAVSGVDVEFIAKAAVYSRTKGYMKDMPAFLCAVLASIKSDQPRELLRNVFPKVIDNGKMLRNFVQIIRSGIGGRKSFGSTSRGLIRRWLAARKEEVLFRDSVGNSPSLVDIIKMVHPNPETPERSAFYAYLLGKEHNPQLLPTLVKEYEAFKAAKKEGTSAPIPDVPFQMLDSLNLTSQEWAAVAQNAGWHMTRMNLNTFVRHGVFTDRPALVKVVSERLRNKGEIAKSRVFPYQIMSAYKNSENIPLEIREALQDAMEIAVENVPVINGSVVVLVDVSGSMSSPITGYRSGSSSKVRCIDVASLISSAILRSNKSATILAFENVAHEVKLNPRDTITTNAERLAAMGGGGTNCGEAMAHVNRMVDAGRVSPDLVIYVSDNESWLDSPNHGRFGGSSTLTSQQWSLLKKKCPNAKLACIDLTPNTTTQVKERPDVMNLGGFSDSVFSVLADFANGDLTPDHFVGRIESVNLEG